jgi:hypothetical protein
LILGAAHFGQRGLPSEQDLDALKLTTEQRRRVAEACEDYADLHREGDRRSAWDDAGKVAAEIIGELPAEQRDAAFYEPERDELAGLNPEELAALVPPRYSN